MQECFSGIVFNKKPDSITPLMALYSSSSPDAPLTPTEPTYSPFSFYTIIPPGNGAIFPPEISMHEVIEPNNLGSFEEVNTSLNVLLGILMRKQVFALARLNSGIPFGGHPSILFDITISPCAFNTLTVTAAN